MSDAQVDAGSGDYSFDDITISDPSDLKRTIIGTAIGNFTEWFDFGVYSYVIPIISAVFFPTSSLATVASFAGLAVSFVVRPFGGMFWGFLGDRVGRKGVLAATILMMAAGTFGLGVLPGYAAIGVAAPILLFALRAIQGFSTGGEYVGAMTFLTEHAPDRQRGHVCSFLPVGTLGGYIFGATLVIVLKETLTHDQMQSWGWRVPFLLAAPLGIAGLYLRTKLEASPAYEGQSDDDRMEERSSWQQIKDTVSSEWKPILVCMGLVLSFNVTNYMLTGYLPTYMSEQLSIPSNPALIIIVIVMAVLLAIVTFLGKLSDRIGRKPIMWTGAGALLVLPIPLFQMMHGADYVMTFVATLPIGLMLVCFMSTEPSTLPALFGTNMRYGATAVAFNVSVSLFGGTTPLIASALVEKTGDLMMPAYMLMVAGLVGLVSIYFVREPAGRRLKGSAPAAASEEEAREMAKA